MRIKRDDIYYADLMPVVGSEQGGTRPVLIIQNDMGNRHSSTVIAAAITSRRGKKALPTHIRLEDGLCGLEQESAVLLEQVRTIDHARLKEYIGRAGRMTMQDVDHARAKNAEYRKARISDDAFDFLMGYLAEYRGLLQRQDYLFINVSSDTAGQPLKVDRVHAMLERAAEKTGTELTPHMLRRYFAVTRWNAGWPLELISQTLGQNGTNKLTRLSELVMMEDRTRAFLRKVGTALFYAQAHNRKLAMQPLAARRVVEGGVPLLNYDSVFCAI